MPASSSTNDIVISHGVDKLLNPGLSLTMTSSINAEAEWLQICDGASTVHVAPSFIYLLFFYYYFEKKQQQKGFTGIMSLWHKKRNSNAHSEA